MKLLLGFLPTLLCAVSVTTAEFNIQRTGANTAETSLTQANTVSPKFGRKCTFATDGEVYGQALVMENVLIGGLARTVVVIASMNNTVYAYAGDTGDCSTLLWSVSLGTPSPLSSRDFSSTILGVLSTPVIDTATNVVYVCGLVLTTGYKIFAFNLADGSTYHAPTTIAATSGAVTFAAYAANSVPLHLQRPGLLLGNGNIYIAFGSLQDGNPARGWMMAYDTTTLAQTGSICLAPSGTLGAIWQSGGAPAMDGSGNIYVMTGNGTWDGTANLGQSFVKLSPSLAVLDFMTPANWADENTTDKDLGSGFPMLINTFVFGAGKDGIVWLLNQGALGSLEGGGGSPPLAQKLDIHSEGRFFGGHVFANNNLYTSSITSNTARRTFDGSTFNATASAAIGNGPVFSGLAYSSNAATAATDILWYAGGTIFKALNGSTLATLYSDTSTITHFGKISVANGNVYVSTTVGVLLYGLLPSSSMRGVSTKRGASTQR